jgi:hypothetical protein
LAVLFLASALNGLGILLHVLRTTTSVRIKAPDYATDELKK